MQDSAKYLIHASITANGVVERSDVVGAIFGQTEGLLGDELDLRELQDSAKLGRIDVQIASEHGRSTGEVTIASGLDRVETAILAAALETIDRVGPCRATIDVTELEDVRTAKRREIVERATDLLAEFDESVLSSHEIIEEVRQRVRVEEITDYEGYPAGPRITESDAIIIVEGRADVLTLLRYGIKNAVAVEGTDVPDAIAELTADRTVTAFLDGDRGGDLILKELAQVGDVDFVTFAPVGRSVEDLSRDEVMDALREKVAYEDVADVGAPHETMTPRREFADAATEPTPETGEERATDASADETAADTDASTEAETADGTASDDVAAEGAAVSSSEGGAATAKVEPIEEADAESDGEATVTADQAAPAAEPESASKESQTVGDHVAAVVGGDSGQVRLLDSSLTVLDERPAAEAFEAIEDADQVPAIVVLDETVSQRVLDIAAQRQVEQVIGSEEGEYVKKPTDVRVRTADEF